MLNSFDHRTLTNFFGDFLIKFHSLILSFLKWFGSPDIVSLCLPISITYILSVYLFYYIFSWQIEHPSMIEIISKPGIQGNFLNFIMNISKKKKKKILHLPQWIETLPVILLRWGTRQRCPFSPLPFIILEILANAIRHQKREKRYTDYDVRSKLC